jgi:hypothetical protein
VRAVRNGCENVAVGHCTRQAVAQVCPVPQVVGMGEVSGQRLDDVRVTREEVGHVDVHGADVVLQRCVDAACVAVADQRAVDRAHVI